MEIREVKRDRGRRDGKGAPEVAIEGEMGKTEKEDLTGEGGGSPGQREQDPK